jgi:hypothetical protein
MKHLLAPVLMLVALMLAGCESMPGKGGGRPGPPPDRARIFQGDPRAVYDAAKVALGQMDFKVTGGGPAQGRIEGVSKLSTGDSLRSTRQISISVRILEVAGGSCEVSVVLKEVIEADTYERQGFATESPLRDTPYYDVFFNNLGQALTTPKKD